MIKKQTLKIIYIISLISVTKQNKCPPLKEMRSKKIKKSFNKKKLNGKWYEISYKDLFQPSFNTGCYNSTIKYNKQRKGFEDKFNFSIKFPQFKFTIPLFYKETDFNGYFDVSADFGIFGDFQIGGSILDLGVGADGEYIWYVESKCLSACRFFEFFCGGLDFVVFFELQIFSRENKMEEGVYFEILERLRDLGMEEQYLEDLKKVDHENCIYPN